LLHGYGQSAEDMSGTGLVVNVLSNVGLLHDLIVVYPSGRCCLTGPQGERTCNDAEAQPGWVRESRGGASTSTARGTAPPTARRTGRRSSS